VLEITKMKKGESSDLFLFLDHHTAMAHKLV